MPRVKGVDLETDKETLRKKLVSSKSQGGMGHDKEFVNAFLDLVGREHPETGKTLSAKDVANLIIGDKGGKRRLDAAVTDLPWARKDQAVVDESLKYFNSKIKQLLDSVDQFTIDWAPTVAFAKKKKGKLEGRTVIEAVAYAMMGESISLNETDETQAVELKALKARIKQINKNLSGLEMLDMAIAP